MSADTIGLLASIYIIGGCVALFAWADGDIDAADAVFWPLAVAKWMVKALFRILFTGWAA